MKNKRMVKLLMAAGYSRDEAVAIKENRHANSCGATTNIEKLKLFAKKLQKQ